MSSSLFYQNSEHIPSFKTPTRLYFTSCKLQQRTFTIIIPWPSFYLDPDMSEHPCPKFVRVRGFRTFPYPKSWLCPSQCPSPCPKSFKISCLRPNPRPNLKFSRVRVHVRTHVQTYVRVRSSLLGPSIDPDCPHRTVTRHLVSRYFEKYKLKWRRHNRYFRVCHEIKINDIFIFAKPNFKMHHGFQTGSRHTPSLDQTNSKMPQVSN